MWVKWPVWRISTGDKIALTKSATQAYLLFLFLFLVFLQRQWNRNYETILFKFQDRWPARRGNCKRYNGRETCSETRHTPLRLLSFDWTYGFPYMQMKVFFFFFTSENIVRFADWLAITHLRIAWDSQAHANELLRKWPTFCDTIMRVPLGLAVNW